MMGYGGYGGGMYGMSNYGEFELTLKVKVGSCILCCCKNLTVFHINLNFLEVCRKLHVSIHLHRTWEVSPAFYILQNLKNLQGFSARMCLPLWQNSESMVLSQSDLLFIIM